MKGTGVSVQTSACVLVWRSESLTGTYLICTGGPLQRYQTAVSDLISSVRAVPLLWRLASVSRP